MTEAEWLTGTDPEPMLEFLRGRASDRKLLLFGVECCRTIRRNGSPQGPDVECVLRLADGADNLEEVRAEWAVMGAPGYPERPFDWCSAFVALAPEQGWEEDTKGFPTRPQLVALFHELFGDPFRRPAFGPSRLAADVRLLAQGIYDGGAFDRMPILADALQDAGCEDPDVLDHCRQGGGHVRGCWVIDQLLGKR